MSSYSIFINTKHIVIVTRMSSMPKLRRNQETKAEMEEGSETSRQKK